MKFTVLNSTISASLHPAVCGMGGVGQFPFPRAKADVILCPAKLLYGNVYRCSVKARHCLGR
jgi:hypothetical protein